jgi:hypothetical protein
MSKKRSSSRKFYVVCVRNDEYAASRETRKIYVAMPDAEAEDEQCIRVIDESGEDYLYPAEFFITLSLPASVERALAKAG